MNIQLLWRTKMIDINSFASRHIGPRNEDINKMLDDTKKIEGSNHIQDEGQTLFEQELNQ